MSSEYTLQAYEMLLATMEAEPVVPDAATAISLKNAQINPVADLYGISVPGGRRTTYSTDAAEASDFRAMGWSISDIVDLDAFVNSLRVELYNTIVNQTTKLPQTPVGQEALIGAAKRVGKQYIRNRYLGPRNYTSPDTGLEAYTDGFEVLTKATDILDLSDADRAARKSAPINMRVFKAGSVRICDVTVDVY